MGNYKPLPRVKVKWWIKSISSGKNREGRLKQKETILFVQTAFIRYPQSIIAVWPDLPFPLLKPNRKPAVNRRYCATR